MSLHAPSVALLPLAAVIACLVAARPRCCLRFPIPIASPTEAECYGRVHPPFLFLPAKKKSSGQSLTEPSICKRSHGQSGCNCARKNPGCRRRMRLRHGHFSLFMALEVGVPSH